jgi:transposase InsO family protein
MNEELGLPREGVEEQNAGEGSLEWSERSERNGSEPSPASPPAGGGPPAESVVEGVAAPAGDDLEGDAAPPDASPGEVATPEPEVPDAEWEAPWQPPQEVGEEPEPAEEDWEVTPMPPNLSARRRGTLSKPKRPQVSLSPPQKLLLLDTWQRSGLPARDFAALVHLSHHTLYAWKKKFDEMGPAGLMDQPKGSKRGSRLPELTKRTILMLKSAHPDWGCQRISDMLQRGPALPASPAAIARVLHEAGYEMEERATRPHPSQVRSFERARPNQLWQTDLFTFVLKRQNRRVYLVAFMDDHSRFITGYGLHASQSAVLVLEVLRAAIAAYGVPEEILTDNGSQYITWRGKSQFTRELEKRGIKQIVARPRRPQTLGKIERFWGSLWRECLEAAVFVDLADARQRIGLWVDHYNLQRPHQGIEGLVPADRFFQAAPEVLKTLKQRVAENARELARHGVPKKPFYLTGQVEGKPFSVHREGDRVILHRAGEAREDIDLKPPRPDRSEVPPSNAQDELPPSICPDGSPSSLWQHQSREWMPGTSALDGFLPAEQSDQQPPKAPPEEGGAQ